MHDAEVPARHQNPGVLVVGICGSGLGAVSDVLTAAGLPRFDGFDPDHAKRVDGEAGCLRQDR